MSAAYLGLLDDSDPLYGILSSHVSGDIRKPLFHVHMMSSEKVYKYTEEHSSKSIIGKFFRKNDPLPDRAMRRRGEFENLHFIRKFGFDAYPHYVVRPYGRDDSIGLALIEEFIHGWDLDYFLKMACHEQKDMQLKRSLSCLASFLHSFHKKTITGLKIYMAESGPYFRKIVERLSMQGVLEDSGRQRCLMLMDEWIYHPRFHSVDGTIIHGDATPTNFLFTKDGDVVAIDLEKMNVGDSTFDLGMICGELKHSFLWRAGNRYCSEPFIQFFLRSYCREFPDPDAKFRDITQRIPFYMGLTELRIARNGYLDMSYRKLLVQEALECLKWGLQSV